MLKPEYDDEGFSILTADRFVSLVWRAGPTESRVAKVEVVLDRFVRKHPGAFGVLVVAGESASLPSGAVREQIVGVLRKTTPFVKSVAWVVPSEGFQGSLVRSLFTALFLMLRPSFKPRAFQSMKDGLAYVLDGIGNADASYRTALTVEIEASLRQVRSAAVG